MENKDKRKMRKLYENVQMRRLKMRGKYEKAEEIKRRRRRRGEDGCGKK